jgi:hypothetical protein
MHNVNRWVALVAAILLAGSVAACDTEAGTGSVGLAASAEEAESNPQVVAYSDSTGVQIGTPEAVADLDLVLPAINPFYAPDCQRSCSITFGTASENSTCSVSCATTASECMASAGVVSCKCLTTACPNAQE